MSLKYVGIDLGSTYSSIAWCDPATNIIHVFANENGELSMPSVVLVEKNGNMIVGNEALQLQSQEDNAKRLVRMIKRNMGTNWRCFPNQPYSKTPEEISSAILSKMVEYACKSLHCARIDGAVITVPAYYDNDPRVATMKSAELAGISVLQLLDEPIASAFVFGSEKLKSGEIVLVYDLGGGTFDVSILEKQGNKLKVLRSQGSRKLGGYDWTNLLANFANKQLLQGVDEDDELCMEEILSESTLEQEVRFEEEIENAKRRLSEQDKVSVRIARGMQSDIVQINRTQFEKATKSLVQQTIEKCEQLLKSIGLWWHNLDYVFLVGSSSKMPMIAATLNTIPNLVRPVSVFQSPDLIVVKGAALQARAYLPNPASRISSFSSTKHHHTPQFFPNQTSPAGIPDISTTNKHSTNPAGIPGISTTNKHSTNPAGILISPEESLDSQHVLPSLPSNKPNASEVSTTSFPKSTELQNLSIEKISSIGIPLATPHPIFSVPTPETSEHVIPISLITSASSQPKHDVSTSPATHSITPVHIMTSNTPAKDISTISKENILREDFNMLDVSEHVIPAIGNKIDEIQSMLDAIIPINSMEENPDSPPDIIYLPGHGDECVRLGTILTTAYPLGTVVISPNYRYMVSHIIPAGQIYPLRNLRHGYHTYAYATHFILPIVQGGIDGAEEGCVGDYHCCVSKGTYRFAGVPMRPEPSFIDVEFIYDRHQIIHVHAWDALTQQSLTAQKIPEMELPPIKRTPQSIVIVLDCSGSMAGKEMEDAKTQIAKIAEEHLTEDNVSEIAIVTFGGPPPRYPAAILHNFTQNSKDLQQVIAKISAYSTTPMAEGIELGLKVLEARVGSPKILNFILISDGSPDNRSKAIQALQKLKQYSIKPFAIAIGDEADHSFLDLVGPSAHIDHSCSLGRTISQFLFANEK